LFPGGRYSFFLEYSLGDFADLGLYQKFNDFILAITWFQNPTPQNPEDSTENQEVGFQMRTERPLSQFT
jgi:hypothetical protein